MQLPIIPYGNELLRKVSTPISPDYPHLSTFIANMWETMYAAKGVGLAAIQVGVPIALFVVDSTLYFAHNIDHNFVDAPGEKQVFINPTLHTLLGTPWEYEEGCLSLPHLTGNVAREETVTLTFFDEHFKQHTRSFSGFTARVILHEYDHTQGVLFIDHLSSVQKKMMQRKLNNIRKGKVKTAYPMAYPTFPGK